MKLLARNIALREVTNDLRRIIWILVKRNSALGHGTRRFANTIFNSPKLQQFLKRQSALFLFKSDQEGTHEISSVSTRSALICKCLYTTCENTDISKLL
jgi:hypothetical protein